MAEDAGEKTEAPTPRRRSEAREQGNIPRSADLSAAVLLISAIILLDWFGTGIVKALKGLMAEMLGPSDFIDFSPVRAVELLLRAVFAVGIAIAPLFIGMMLVAIIVNIMQVGFFFSSKRLQPNIAALNPLKGLKKLFGKGRGAFSIGMNIAKVGLVGLVAYSAIHGRLPEIVSAQRLEFLQIFSLAAGVIYSIAIRIGVLLLILAIVDYIYQRFRVEKELKMTKQEVKEEMKRMEGDPQIKARRRQIAQQIAYNKLKQEVPTADVVVTNPTEFAVALKYDAQTMHAPRVVAKGRDHMAMRIREIAIANGVPILERKPLARALYRMCEVGQEIPEQFYSAVAEILAYVYELAGKARRKAS
jgi:flagellar biosynthetic protein FlhB